MPATSEHYYYGTGRRKSAVARVRLVPGDGVLVINGRSPSEYFGRRDLETVVTQPLRVTDNLGRFVASIKVEGGGVAGQAGAICHGIARALVVRRRGAAPRTEEGRPAHSRPAREGAQEVRPQARSQGTAVHQAIAKGELRSPLGHPPPAVSAPTT